MKQINASLKRNYVQKQKHILVRQNMAGERQKYKSVHLEEAANMRLPQNMFLLFTADRTFYR
jgi:hypothetical protein